MLITNGEPDTRRRVSPVPREGVGNLLFDMKEKGAFSLPYDLLASREVENIFENSDFVYMLNQAGGDRQILAKQLNISPHQLSYVTHSGEGEGLLFYGNVILPFVDRFPKDTELYSVMTTKPNEVKKEG
jgi:hypothetical protein